MTVTTPPRRPDTGQDRDLERWVADLEALIKEARRRARRRRACFAAVVLGALGAAAWASFGIGGNGGVSVGFSASSDPSGGVAPREVAARWRSVGGPDGGDVLSLAVDPVNTRVVYAGTWGNVFKSTDGGSSWRDVSHEPWTQVTALAVDPTRPSVVYAGTESGIAKTMDGGRHWRMVNTGLFDRDSPFQPAHRLWGDDYGTIDAFVVDAHRPGTVYALTGGGLFRTTNGGARWRVVAPQRFEIPSHGSYGRYWYSVAAAIDPDHAQTIYASWDTAGGLSGFPRRTTDLYKSSDGGDSWQRIDVRGGAPWFSSLALDTGSPGTILATSSWGPGVFKSSDGGTTWSLAGLAVQHLGEGLEADPGRPGTVYTSSGSALFRTSNGGASWESLGNVANLGWGGAVATDPTNPATVYGPGGNGVVKSLDGGHTWTESNTGLVSTLVSALVLAPRSSKTLYAAAGGVLKSSDGGRSWKTTSGPKGASVIVLAVDPHHPQTIYAGSSDHGLFNSFDGGAHWNRMSSDARPNFVTLAIDPNHPGTLYISACINRLGCGYHALFLKTTNGGASWQQIGARVIPWAVRTIAIDPTRSNIVFAGTSRGGLYRSTDTGHSWRRVAIAHGGPTSHRGAPNAISTIAIDSHNPNTIYAGTTDNGILESTDDGSVWTTVNTGLTNLDVNTLAVDPHNPRVLYASTQGGVFRSTNGASSWQRLNRGLTGDLVTAFAITPTGTVYAATQGDGIAQLTASH